MLIVTPGGPTLAGNGGKRYKIAVQADKARREMGRKLAHSARTDQTERIMNAESREAAYPAWQRARRDIFDEWTFATDPVNLQPKVRPLLKRAADVVRRFPTNDMDQQAIDRVANSLKAPWGARIENRIREALGDGVGSAAAVRVIDAVKELGRIPRQPRTPIEAAV